jgi:hypothetical protein
MMIWSSKCRPRGIRPAASYSCHVSLASPLPSFATEPNIWDVNTEDDYHETKEEPAKEEALQETA